MTATEIISILVALTCFIIIVSVGLKSNLLHEKKDKNTPYSFSRVQLWLWTMVIIPAFALNWGFQNPDIPIINITALVLLGIPSSTAVTAGIVSSVQEQANTKRDNTAKLSLKSKGEKESFWNDILRDDDAQLSIARLQQLLFTFVFIVVFLTLFFAGGEMNYPEFDDYVFVLMGISTGTYIVAKANRK